MRLSCHYYETPQSPTNLPLNLLPDRLKSHPLESTICPLILLNFPVRYTYWMAHRISLVVDELPLVLR